MAKYAVNFRLAGSKKRVSRNVLIERDEADAAKVIEEVAGVLADEYRVKREHVVLLEITPRDLVNPKVWRRPADAPKPPDGVVLDDEYKGPTKQQIAEMKKAELIDLVLAKELEIETGGSVDSLRAAVLKALNPPR